MDPLVYAANVCLCLQNRLMPPPIFARIDTPTSLSEDELERNRSSIAPLPAITSQTADKDQQIAVDTDVYHDVICFFFKFRCYLADTNTETIRFPEESLYTP